MIRALAVLTAALLLTGCAAQPEPDPVEVGLAVFRDANPELDSLTDTEVKVMAQNTCIALEGGASYDDFIRWAYNNGIPAKVTGSVLAYAVYAFCPEEEEQQ